MCVCVCIPDICVCHVHAGATEPEDTGCHGAGGTGSCKLPNMGVGTEPGSSARADTPLTSEPSLQPLHSVFLKTLHSDLPMKTWVGVIRVSYLLLPWFSLLTWKGMNTVVWLGRLKSESGCCMPSPHKTQGLMCAGLQASGFPLCQLLSVGPALPRGLVYHSPCPGFSLSCLSLSRN